MSKKHLIVNTRGQQFLLRPEGEELKATHALVVNWKGTWAPSEDPDHFMVVAPGDELEIAIAPGARVVAFIRLESTSKDPVLVTTEEPRPGYIEIVEGSKTFEVNRKLPPDAGELRCELILYTKPRFGGGNAGTLVAGKP